MRKKGQVEFLIILGIVVVVAVVVVLSLQMPGPGPTTFATGTIEDSILSFVRAGAYDTIKTMGLHGGYNEPTITSVTFLGQGVPYWQKDGIILAPDIAGNLADGLEAYINANKDALASSFDKPVTIGSPQVTVNVLASKVDLTVNMPTTVDGRAIQQPYVISLPSKIGDINEFASGFVAANNQNRFFEVFTLSSMVISPFDEGIQETPVLISLSECGDFLFKSWWDIQPGMTNVIKRTLANTYMPGKGPRNVGETTSSPKYLLTPINSKNYADLDVEFYLPDDFELTRMNFDFSPEPINTYARPIPMTGICQSDTLNVQYYVKYPVIVRVEDSLTGNAFQFAIDVAIKDNAPAEWSGLSAYQLSEQAELCQNTFCSMKLVIEDSAGQPIPYASATFFDCPAGRADENGMLEADIPCGIGKLSLYKRGYDVYEEIRSSDNLEDATETMTKTPVVNLHFYEVVIDDLSSISEYWVKDGAINPIDNHIRDSGLWMTVYEPATHQNHEFAFKESSGRLVGVPAGQQAFSAILYENFGQPSMSVGGVLAADFTLTEAMDGQDLYVYIPYYPNVDLSASDEDVAIEAAKLANVLRRCGIGPITTTKVADDTSCTVSYSDALTVQYG
jgi:hypothetical protein